MIKYLKSLKQLTACVLITGILASPLHAGDHVSNGGGLSEQHFTLALLNLRKFIALGMADRKNTFTPTELGILKKIDQALGDHKPEANWLDFRSGKINPAFFYLDDATRIAKTTLYTGDESSTSIGETIYINRDLIYYKDKTQTTAMSMAEAVRVLTHELGHQVGIKSHTELDLLGSKLQNIAQLRITEGHFDPILAVTAPDLLTRTDFPGFTSIDFSSDYQKSFDSRLIFNVTSETMDATDALNAAVASFLATTPGFQGQSLEGFHLTAPHWSYAIPFADGIYFFFMTSTITIASKDNITQKRITLSGKELFAIVAVNYDTKGLPHLMNANIAIDPETMAKQMFMIQKDANFQTITMISEALKKAWDLARQKQRN